MIKALTAFALLAAAAPALADTVVVNGDTTAGPTYNRPLSGAPPGALSSVGTAVRYQVTAFTVGTSGSYDFNSVAAYDNFLGLHQNSFDPSNSLTNALIYNDDRGSIGISGFAINLTAGTSYFAVASGFGNGDFGAYALTISGPGTISVGGGTAVPEPAAWAMMIGGFGLAGAAMRRRTTKVSFA